MDTETEVTRCRKPRASHRFWPVARSIDDHRVPRRRGSRSSHSPSHADVRPACGGAGATGELAVDRPVGGEGDRVHQAQGRGVEDGEHTAETRDGDQSTVRRDGDRRADTVDRCGPGGFEDDRALVAVEVRPPPPLPSVRRCAATIPPAPGTARRRPREGSAELGSPGGAVDQWNADDGGSVGADDVGRVAVDGDAA